MLRAAGLLVALVPHQTASRATHQVDARTGEAAHAYIEPIVASLGGLIVKDVLNVDPSLSIDRLARRLVADVALQAHQKPNRWVMLSDILPKLGV